MTSQDEWMTTEQVADLLQVKRETVQKWIRDGDLPALDLGGPRAGYRVARSDLDAYIQARYTGKAAA